MVRYKVVIWLIALGALALAGAQPADEIPAKPESTPVLTVPEIPKAEKARRNPIAATPASIAEGKRYFSSQCAMCHGVRGDGTGDLVERLQLVMPDLTDAKFQSKWTDGALFYVITEGHGRMPAHHERYKAEIKWSLVNYMRTLDDK